MQAYVVEAGTAQHIGDRPEQHDRTAVFANPRLPGYVLAVLAEGLAGGASGADQVLHTSRQLFDEFRPGDAPGIERLTGLLREIALETSLVIQMNSITSHLKTHSSFTALILTPQGQAAWAHVGETRLYHFAGGQCRSRSNDAQYVAHLIEDEKLPPEAAKNHRRTHLLHNVLGNPERPAFVCVASHTPLQAGDVFLLCSAGLWHYFTDAELAAVTTRNTPRQAAELLINKAIERAKGNGDNCSMTIVRLTKPVKEEPTPSHYTVQKMRRAV